jgi:MOSC domain-containing protein YiiM
MKTISVNVGRPQDVPWRGTTVRTSIFKAPAPGRRYVSSLNVQGDEQSDLTVHGGADKAVYVYPAEHYPFWREELPDVEFPWGVFGENLTSEGLLDVAVHIGDRLRVGSAEFIVTQPRMPCYKLNVRFGRADMTKRFRTSGRSGFYLAVVREVEIGPDDEIELLARDPLAVCLTDVVNLYLTDGADRDLLRRVIEIPALPANWKEYFRQQISDPSA